MLPWRRRHVTSWTCGGGGNPAAGQHLQAEAATGAQRLLGEGDARGLDVLDGSTGGHRGRRGGLRAGGLRLRAGRQRRRRRERRRGRQGGLGLGLPERPPAAPVEAGRAGRGLGALLAQRGGAAAFGHGAGGGVHVGVVGLELGALPGEGGLRRLRRLRRRRGRGGGGEVEGRLVSVAVQEEPLGPLAVLALVTRGSR